MEIKTLLAGYQHKIVTKIDEEGKKKIEEIVKNDKIKKVFSNIGNLIANQLKECNEMLSETEEIAFTAEEIESIANKLNLSYSYKVTKQTLTLVKEVKEKQQERKDTLSNILNEVYLLASYLEKPEEVTKLLKTYGILDDNGKLNMNLV